MSTSTTTLNPQREKSAGSLHSPTLKPSTASVSTTKTSKNAAPSFGASFASLLATQRLAHRAANRFKSRRVITASSNASTKQQPPSYEPTYRMKPTKKFKVKQVEAVIKDIVDSRMKNFKYTPKVAAMMSKILTSEIKDAIKQLEFERYKIVCLVTVGENTGQGMRLTSRYTWDTAYDSSASYSWKDAQTFCSATVFGVYHE